MVVEHESEHLICWFPEGRLNRDSIMEYYTALRECVWGSRADRFCDFSQVDAFDLDYNALSDIVAFRRQYLSDHTEVKLLILSTSPLGFGMARMYESLMEDWDMDIMVTKSLTEAASYLGVAESLLTRATPSDRVVAD